MMSAWRAPWWITLLLASSLLASPAHAGSTPPTESPFLAEDLLAFAKKVEREVAARGARVFIIARTGEPEDSLPDGVRYTHTALGVYAMSETRDGRKLPGYVIYNLYQRPDQPQYSRLVRDYPANFFAGAQVLRAGIVIPSSEVQRRILETVASGEHERLHNPRYSLLSNPYDMRFQNCTEYTLDVLNAAIYQTTDRRVIKANTRAWFHRQPINVNPFKLLYGRLFRADVPLSDQPERPVQIATFSSIADYLQDNGLSKARFEVFADRARPGSAQSF